MKHATTMLRTLAGAGALALAITLATAPTALAEEQWTSQDGRLQVTIPDGWPVDIIPTSTPGALVAAAGTPAQECRFYVTPNAVTAGADIASINRAYATPFGDARWRELAIGFPFLENDVTVVSSGVNAEGFFPRQHALLQSQGRAVHAAIVGRVGYDVYGFCTSYEGADAPEQYDAILASVGAAGDAAAEAAASPAPVTPPAS